MPSPLTVRKRFLGLLVGADSSISVTAETPACGYLVRTTVKAPGTCVHLTALAAVKHPRRSECDECVKIAASWVHLRTCQECGTTLCCDDSPNRHATEHARASGHPVIASAEPGERWLYCYPDDAFAEY